MSSILDNAGKAEITWLTESLEIVLCLNECPMLISKECILVNSCVSPDHSTTNYKNLSLILRLHNPSLISSPAHLHEPSGSGCVITGRRRNVFWAVCPQGFHSGTVFFLVALGILWHTPALHELWGTVCVAMSPPGILTFWSLWRPEHVNEENVRRSKIKEGPGCYQETLLNRKGRYRLRSYFQKSMRKI